MEVIFLLNLKDIPPPLTPLEVMETDNKQLLIKLEEALITLVVNQSLIPMMDIKEDILNKELNMLQAAQDPKTTKIDHRIIEMISD